MHTDMIILLKKIGHDEKLERQTKQEAVNSLATITRDIKAKKQLSNEDITYVHELMATYQMNDSIGSQLEEGSDCGCSKKDRNKRVESLTNLHYPGVSGKGKVPKPNHKEKPEDKLVNPEEFLDDDYKDDKISEMIREELDMMLTERTGVKSSYHDFGDGIQGLNEFANAEDDKVLQKLMNAALKLENAVSRHLKSRHGIV